MKGLLTYLNLQNLYLNLYQNHLLFKLPECGEGRVSFNLLKLAELVLVLVACKGQLLFKLPECGEGRVSFNLLKLIQLVLVLVSPLAENVQ